VTINGAYGNASSSAVTTVNGVTLAMTVVCPGDNNAYLYVDGVLNQSWAYTDSISNVSTTGPVIGPFQCAVGDVLLYKRALSVGEIQELHDPSNAMLSGLILPPRRRLWAVSGGAPPVTTRNYILGGGVL
jgi:hypothetical protein